MILSEFKRRIDEYFDECADANAFPDEAGLLLALDLTREQHERLLAGNAKSNGKLRALQDARLRRESLLTRELFATEKAATAKIFLARQPFAGAMSEKPREQTETTSFEVRLVGEKNAFE